ncbi:hypothetical protein ABIB42_004635, partial [Massilia sp. UYP32]
MTIETTTKALTIILPAFSTYIVGSTSKIAVVVNKDVASSHAAFLNCSGGFRSGFSQTSS